MPGIDAVSVGKADTAIAMLPIVLALVGEHWHVRAPACEAQARFVR
jgi:hypothetical protein